MKKTNQYICGKYLHLYYFIKSGFFPKKVSQNSVIHMSPSLVIFMYHLPTTDR